MKESIKLKLDVYESDTPGGPPTGPIMHKDVDLILDNFGMWMAAVFYPYYTVNPNETVSLNDTGGAGRTIGIWYQTAQVPWNTTTGGMRVGVGTGATGALRTDVNLQTQVGSWTLLSGAGTWTSATGLVQFAGAVLIAAGATVTEAGVIVNFPDTASNSRMIMLFHDVFAGVAIAAGKYANVNYTLAM